MSGTEIEQVKQMTGMLICIVRYAVEDENRQSA